MHIAVHETGVHVLKYASISQDCSDTDSYLKF